MTHYDDHKETFRCEHGFVRGMGKCAICEPPSLPCVHGYKYGACSWCDLRDDGGLPEAQQQIEVDVRVLKQAIGNCYMMAKRQIAAHLNGTSTPEKDLERWQYIQRFCETTGSKSSILRGQLPTEMTEGSPYES